MDNMAGLPSVSTTASAEADALTLRSSQKGPLGQIMMPFFQHWLGVD
jgi:hypothetical protein